MRLFAAALMLGAAFAAPAQDYEREARWKAEVLGNLVVGDAVDLALPGGRSFLGLYTPGEKAAILLVHGIGVHPDHGVIGMLRVALADMGFATLSVQMPVLAADAQSQDYYPALFPEASARIAAAAQWLSSKNKKVVLASHSLGSWMSEHHLRSGAGGFAAWVCMGRGGSIAPVALPVLDVYGEKDNLPVIEAANARRAVLEKIPGSKQVRIPGADHFYSGKEEELARLIADFAGKW
jgi:alpha/beta superfamily hydrolase